MEKFQKGGQSVDLNKLVNDYVCVMHVMITGRRNATLPKGPRVTQWRPQLAVVVPNSVLPTHCAQDDDYWLSVVGQKGTI